MWSHLTEYSAASPGCCGAGYVSTFSGGWFPRGRPPGSSQASPACPEGALVSLSQCALSHTSAAGHMLVPQGGLSLALMLPPALACTTHLWGVIHNSSWSLVLSCCLDLFVLCGQEILLRDSREYRLPIVNLGSPLTSRVAPGRLQPLFQFLHL